MKEAENMKCPFCGGRIAGIGRNYYNGYITITCTNPKCNASTHFKTDVFEEAMEHFGNRASADAEEQIGLLKVCPFCNQAATLYSSEGIYVVGCNTPACRGNAHDVSGGWNSVTKAIAKWNQRGGKDADITGKANEQ